MPTDRGRDVHRPAAPGSPPRPTVSGKFLRAGRERLHVRGFTYGPFSPNADAEPFPDRERAATDLRAIAATGANAVRFYDVPPRWLLDEAFRTRLRVLVGIPWEQHVAFLDEPGLASSIEGRVRAAVRSCAGHPAVLAYAVGNEIPAAVVRWTGQERVERHLRGLVAAAREEDPGALVTYANYPSTEYLHLDFLDFLCFNVYLDSPARLRDYLKRLHNLAGNRPLVLGEIGVDAISRGELGQARGLSEQLDTAVRSGCAGTFVFSWTDEWHAGGRDIAGWGFGVTDTRRRPRAAHDAVAARLRSPRLASTECPRFSVVVCAYNAAATLGECLRGCTSLEYPSFEVILVDDGSTDATRRIAATFDGVRVISTENRGLSNARNAGIEAATGELVAFVDADAWPDPDWLTQLAIAFEDPAIAGAGGPNIVPPDGNGIADCVANAPGGPVHVLVSDDEAEHIPGCNMAFRRDVLLRIGGFDPRFREAGDDVDLCWRIRDAGLKLGFSPAAVVWHRSRTTPGAYWKQQAGYGRAEALLEEKWPENYNAVGHVTWGGRVYGGDAGTWLLGRQRVYHGVWGNAPYQSAEPRPVMLIEALAATPEWYLVLAALAFLSLLGTSWPPLGLALPLLAAAVTPVIGGAVVGACRARFPTPASSSAEDFRRRVITAGLFLMQPAARLRGRLRHGLTPWRLRAARRFLWPRTRVAFVWSDAWREPSSRLARLEEALRRMRATVLRGGPFDRWDLLLKGGFAGCVRISMCTEEHGNGKQFVRLRFRPRFSTPVLIATLLSAVLAGMAAIDGGRVAALVLAGLALWLVVRGIQECGGVLSAGLEAVDVLEVPDRLEATDLRSAGGGPARGAADLAAAGGRVAWDAAT